MSVLLQFKLAYLGVAKKQKGGDKDEDQTRQASDQEAWSQGRSSGFPYTPSTSGIAQ